MFVFHFDSSFDESTEQMGLLCPWSDLKFVKKNMRPQFLRQTDHAKKTRNSRHLLIHKKVIKWFETGLNWWKVPVFHT